MKNMEGRTCKIASVAVGDKAGSAEFSVGGVLSGLTAVVTDPQRNLHAKKAKKFMRTTVEVRNLADVFRENDVPDVIDYLSLDVEGGEIDILKTFPFQEYCVRNISIETNFQAGVATEIHRILLAHGYQFHAHNEFDDFYTKSCSHSPATSPAPS
jgi:FkbM family methyltransferase